MANLQHKNTKTEELKWKVNRRANTQNKEQPDMSTLRTLQLLVSSQQKASEWGDTQPNISFGWWRSINSGIGGIPYREPYLDSKSKSTYQSPVQALYLGMIRNANSVQTAEVHRAYSKIISPDTFYFLCSRFFRWAITLVKFKSTTSLPFLPDFNHKSSNYW